MKRILSLMYHDVFISAENESGFQDIGAIKYKISRDSFENQIRAINSYFSENLIDKENLRLTFDDGGVSALTVIAPILEKYGFKGYFFITTKLIGTQGFLSICDIRELDHRGHIIGAHSHTHPRNIAALRIPEIEYEWVESVRILNDILMKPVLFAAIPGGFYSEDSRRILFNLGVHVIFNSKPTTAIKQYGTKMILGRYSVSKGMPDELILALVRTYSLVRFIQLIRWHLLNIIKTVLGKWYYPLKGKLLQLKSN